MDLSPVSKLSERFRPKASLDAAESSRRLFDRQTMPDLAAHRGESSGYDHALLLVRLVWVYRRRQLMQHQLWSRMNRPWRCVVVLSKRSGMVRYLASLSRPPQKFLSDKNGARTLLMWASCLGPLKTWLDVTGVCGGSELTLSDWRACPTAWCVLSPVTFEVRRSSELGCILFLVRFRNTDPTVPVGRSWLNMNRDGQKAKQTKDCGESLRSLKYRALEPIKSYLLYDFL